MAQHSDEAVKCRRGISVKLVYWCKRCCCCVQFWPARMKELRRLILEEQQKALKKTVPCAFVTFR